VLGGLLVSTLVTLTFLPALMISLFGWLNRSSRHATR